MSEQYDSTKAKRVAKYKKEAERDSYPKITKAGREYIADPVTNAVGKLIPSDWRPQSWEAADREARKEVLGYKRGGKTSSASSRADGIAQRGKTKGRMF
jgi:hypothetical protein